MSNVIIPIAIPFPLQPFKYANTGHIPQATWMRLVTNALNHCRRYRTKELYSSPGSMVIPNSGGAPARARSYFRCHTGYGARRFILAYSIALQKAAPAAPGGVRFTAVPVGGGSTITKDLIFGANDAAVTPLDALYEMSVGFMWTDPCAENTTYDCTVEDFSEGRLQHLLVHAESKGPDTANGYLDPVYAVDQDILDKHRKDLVEKATELYLQNSQPLFNFSCDTDATAPAITSVTETNIIDGTSTGAPSASSPGFYCDMTYKRTLARTTVPCVFAVLASSNTGSGGLVRLKDSSGILATIAGISTKQWYTTTVNMPATAERRDVQAADISGNTITVFAACLYLKD